jgi:hypothetical protein
MTTPTLKVNSRKLLTVSLVFSSFITFNASACDDKSCEKAYLLETVQHISNHVRHAETYKTERHAYSRNRERRAYALYNHIHVQKGDPVIAFPFQSASL